ncbi:MAG: 2-amino-4-hydroxy-6-hydroxymethyldihydropteridine diphosphokinase [Candidatus Thiodiazotropha sp.]
MSESSPVLAYVALGSNLEQPRVQVSEALKELTLLPETRVSACSSLYRTRPLGPAGQPDYINAVAALSTRLAAESLLDALQGLEQRHGRVRTGERWGPRTLDLDLLLYADCRISTVRLQVPHPRIGERAFVLVPLAEIAPQDLLIPDQGLLRDLLAQVSEADVERLA